MARIAPATELDVEPSVSNHFAWLRTLMGIHRTEMAAIRTSVSLIGFGFTVAQFFDKLSGNLPGSLKDTGPDVPRDLGLLLIGAGVISLAIFTWHYRIAIQYMRTGAFAPLAATADKPLHQPTYVFAFGVLLIGVAAFIAVLARF